MGVDISKHIINLQGKDFVQFPGLVKMAHDAGFAGMETKCIQWPSEENGTRARYEAVAKFLVFDPDGSIVVDGHGTPILATYRAEGDASPNDVKPNMQKFLIRMAETRAMARCLRVAVGSDYTSAEELDERDFAGSGKVS